MDIEIFEEKELVPITKNAKTNLLDIKQLRPKKMDIIRAIWRFKKQIYEND